MAPHYHEHLPRPWGRVLIISAHGHFVKFYKIYKTAIYISILKTPPLYIPWCLVALT